MIQTILISLLMFGLLIGIHEFGHFIAAKAVGVTVHEFSIGMGPQIFSRVKGDTRYSLRLFPIGGFVAMEGEEEVSDSAGSFSRKSLPQRMLVVSAGILMNFILAVFLMILLYFLMGAPSTEVRDTIADSPAAAAGMEPGDEIVSVNGTAVSSWNEFVLAVDGAKSDTITVGVVKAGDREATLLELSVARDETGDQYVGVYPRYKKDLLGSIQRGFVGSFQLCTALIDGLKMLFTGNVALDEVVGPVGIVTVVDDAASRGFLYVIYLTALISMNLGLVNALPIPALDGGRLLFMLLPLVIRRPIKEETEIKWHYVGFLFLMGFSIFILFKDINQFILHLF